MTETRSISAFVLAGGQGSRMGRDKALLEWRGRTLLDHMIERLSAFYNPVLVVGRGELPDRIPGLGPLGGLSTALQSTQTQRNLIVAVDLPSLTPEFLKVFRNRIEASSQQVVACKIESGYPLCLGVDRAALPLLLHRIDSGQFSIHGFIEAADSEIITDFDATLFTNVNTPEDWMRFTRHFSFG
jgi:molybdenum cofactor guanylyltransferase